MLPVEGLISMVDSIAGLARPDPSLPFEERWSKAQALRNRLRVDFVRRELPPIVTSGSRWIELVRSDIEESVLPSALRYYLLAPLNPRQYQERWGVTPRIEVYSAGDKDHYKMDLFIGTRGPTGYGFGIAMDIGTSKGAHTPAWILPRIWPSWEFDGPRPELADSPLLILYGELKRYIADNREQSPHHVTHLRLMKELVGFIRQVAERQSR